MNQPAVGLCTVVAGRLSGRWLRSTFVRGRPPEDAEPSCEHASGRLAPNQGARQKGACSVSPRGERAIRHCEYVGTHSLRAPPPASSSAFSPGQGQL